MKKIYFVVALMLSVFSIFSCKEPVVYTFYRMPYTPGVTVDSQTFEEKKESWNNSKPDDYDYTLSFSNINTHASCVVDVAVRDGHVSDYVLKEFEGKTEVDVSESDWNLYKESFDAELKNAESLLIENLYELIGNFIDEEIAEFNKNSDCYYSKFSFGFLNQNPFMGSCEIDSVLMKENLDGNGSRIEIKIDNFESVEAAK